MIWAQVSDGTQTKKLAFMALPRQGEVISAAISTPVRALPGREGADITAGCHCGGAGG